jgi:hypothetical protein
MSSNRRGRVWLCASSAIVLFLTAPLLGQLVDRTLAPNISNEGIALSLREQVGAGRGHDGMVDSSAYIIRRDPFRSIRRGRQLFQRKFTRLVGQGPLAGDGAGDIGQILKIGAGLADSCASCHGRPRGSAGFGGDVVTRPDSRDSPHLFGLGLKEMLADEITSDLRAIRADAIEEARRNNRSLRRRLVSKGISFGNIIVSSRGVVDTREVEGVDRDLRVRPLFAHGGTISIREFIVGALDAEMGIQVNDPDTRAASSGERVTTAGGMILDGRTDTIEAPPSLTSELDPALIDHLEFYLLNYFKAGRGEITEDVNDGRRIMSSIGCTRCHVQDLVIQRDRRVADVETVFDPQRGNLNRLFATATPLFVETPDGIRPSFKRPARGQFVVRNIFTDFKRHDLGANFHELNYNGTLQREFLTTALWGVGSTSPYGHDGRSINLTEVILRHGGEAEEERDAFARLDRRQREDVIAFLNSLILFPPDDTASNLDPGDRGAPSFPQFGHGSIRLGALFNDPTRPE